METVIGLFWDEENVQSAIQRMKEVGVAAGIALGHKIDDKANRVWCLNGDGEMQEGSIWEGAVIRA